MEAATAAQRHTEAKSRATAYKAKPFEVPSEPGCAGECSQPVPEPPVRRSSESFVSRVPSPTGAQSWLLLMAGATVAYAILTMGVRR